MSSNHKFTYEQHVETQKDIYPPVVEVVALLPARCMTHLAPMYGCVHGDNHFTFCEESLKPLSKTNRSKMN